MYELGLKIDPDNAALKKGLQECSKLEKNNFSQTLWMKILADPELAEMAKTDEKFVQKVQLLLQLSKQ